MALFYSRTNSYATILLNPPAQAPHLTNCMEKTLAIHSLTEAAELIRMTEEVATLPAERVVSLLPGMRITMRLARERILMGQQVFSNSTIEEKAPQTSIHHMVELSREESSPSSEAQAYIQNRRLSQQQKTPEK